ISRIQNLAWGSPRFVLAAGTRRRPGEQPDQQGDRQHPEQQHADAHQASSVVVSPHGNASANAVNWRVSGARLPAYPCGPASSSASCPYASPSSPCAWTSCRQGRPCLVLSSPCRRPSCPCPPASLDKPSCPIACPGP